MKNILVILIITIIGTIISTQIELRGIVEGFYGTPWTFEDRADLIKFTGKHNLIHIYMLQKMILIIEINGAIHILMIKFKN